MSLATRILTVLMLLILTVSFSASSADRTISFAVGHDHQKMLTANYPIYRANWEFLNKSLSLMGYSIEVQVAPWARAKHLTQTAKADGLFMAANFEGRDKWAKLSKPIGYGIFGGFYNMDRADAKSVVAAVRLGQYDKILSNYTDDDLIFVATAHQGFKLLFNKRIDRFVMSESYGRYLLNTELSEYCCKIAFDFDNIEKRTIHVAFSNSAPSSLKALEVLNKAIDLGFEYGLYQEAMEKHKVPMRMRVPYAASN